MAWELDSNLTKVRWDIGYMGITRVGGEFSDVTVDLNLDSDDPTQWSFNATIASGSVRTGFRALEDHVRSADFLDAETYPAITFTSHKVEALGATENETRQERPAAAKEWDPHSDRYRVHGDLTLHGVTKHTDIDVVYRGSSTDPRGKKRRAFTGDLIVKRSDFSIYQPPQIDPANTSTSDDIHVELNVFANQV
jgi:polyisoprenoid-binding protein YceI